MGRYAAKWRWEYSATSNTTNAPLETPPDTYVAASIAKALSKASTTPVTLATATLTDVASARPGTRNEITLRFPLARK